MEAARSTTSSLPQNDQPKMLLDLMPRLDRPNREGHAHVISLTNDKPILDVGT